jgi:mRNA interferase MazF
VKRGEIWTASAGSGCVGKPRPVVIIQDDRFDATGIRESSRLMVDKITTIPRSKLGERVGQLSDDDMIRLSRALVVFLGLAGA